VSVGQGAMIHGAVIEEGVHVGTGAIIMDGARVGARSVVAAGALVRRGSEFPPDSFVRGRPARVIRQLTEAERDLGRREALSQHELALKSER
jgi:carbonic anhydrase/acetyltransferase-like protein (isoleucine patch superfamily)